MMLEIIDFFWSNDEEKIIYVSNFYAHSEDIATVRGVFKLLLICNSKCQFICQIPICF